MKQYIFVLIFYCCLSSLKAQLCNNNLGDPIVNITFGTSSAPEKPDVTTFDFAYGCPSKGQYTIADFLFGCGGYWVPMTGDHTPFPDLNGNYMLVNAESTSGILVQDTASGLCENMLYQFSAYVTNVMQDNLSCGANVVLPDLIFSIESLSGTVLATYNTGNIPITNEKKWVQHGFTYKTTQGVNAVILKISIDPAYGCGSAFALDDIVFQNCGPAVSVTIDGGTEDQNVCADYTNPFIMQGSYSAGFTNPAVQWQSSFDSGKTWKDIQGATTTTYKVPRRASGVIEYRMIVAEKENINSPNCRIRSNAIYTEIHPVPVHNAPQYINGCTGKDFVLPPANATALEIEWSGPNGFSSYTTYPYPPDTVQSLQYADTGLYILNQVFYYGCKTIDSFYISASPGIVISAQPAHGMCEGESQNLLLTTSVAGSFIWTPSAGLSNTTIANPVASPKDSTQYKVIATNGSGCSDSAFFTVDVYKKPIASAGPDKTILNGKTAVLEAYVKGTALTYYWSPPVSINDVNTLQPIVNPAQDITYTLTATSTLGCGTAVDNVFVSVYKGFFIPSAFTPNGDGLNDKFSISVYDNYTVNKFLIYNRWGAVIFKSNNPGDGWDGTYKNYPQPMGSYIYYLEMKDPDNKIIIKQGTISLLR